MLFMCICIFLLFPNVVESKFTYNPGFKVLFCEERTGILTWTYDLHVNDNDRVLVVAWKKNEKYILALNPLKDLYVYGEGYSWNKIKHLSNGAIELYNVNKNDSGSYECEVTYTSGVELKSSKTQVEISSCTSKPLDVDRSGSISSHQSTTTTKWLITLYVLIMTCMY